jgi:hypothetical protein
MKTISTIIASCSVLSFSALVTACTTDASVDAPVEVEYVSTTGQVTTVGTFARDAKQLSIHNTVNAARAGAKLSFIGQSQNAYVLERGEAQIKDESREFAVYSALVDADPKQTAVYEGVLRITDRTANAQSTLQTVSPKMNDFGGGAGAGSCVWAGPRCFWCNTSTLGSTAWSYCY